MMKKISKGLPPIESKASGGSSKGKASASRPSSGKGSYLRPYVPKLRPIDLIQALSSEHVQYFDEKQLAIIRNLEKIKNAASDIQNAIRLFQEVDEDGSGLIFSLFLFLLIVIILFALAVC